MRTRNIAICVASTPRSLSPATIIHDYYGDYCSLLAPFFNSKNSVASTALRLNVRYSTKSKTFLFNVALLDLGYHKSEQ